jgi:PAS domain S-box-containing protein/putative nucleotidyltransferase with HDIG domain
MGKPLRALIVEDSEDDALLLLNELECAGYDTTSHRVETDKAMGSALKEGIWDVVIADYVLPQFSGLRALQLLKESGLELPFIMVSGKVGEDTAVEIMKAGAHDCIMKNNLKRLAPAIERELLQYTEREERKNAEEALKASRLNFRNSLDGSPLGIRIITAENETLYANQAVLDIYGYVAIDDFRTIPVEKRHTKESYIIHQQMKEKMLGTHVPYNYRIDIVRKDGAIRHLELFYKEVLWDGKTQIQVLYHDVTERVQAEKALSESEENFRNSLDNSPLGIRIVSEDGQTIYTNKAILDIYGYTSLNELQMTPAEKRHTLESYAEHQKMKDKMLSIHVPLNYEVDIVRNNGEIRRLLANRGEVLWNGKKQVQVLYQDITERKQAEEALRASEERIRNLADLLPQAVYESNSQGMVTYMNRIAREQYRYSDDDLAIGISVAQLVAPEERLKVVEHMNDPLSIGLPNRQEYTAINKDGRTFPAVGYSSIIFKNDHIAGLRVITIDITEQQKTREKLLNSMKSTIAAVALTTELRDPYTAGHQQRVAKLASAIAGEMGLEKDRASGLRLAGIVHDIGKMYVPSEILSKPGRLSDIEFSLIKLHPEAGYNVLKDIEFPWPIAQTILQHHERLDGSGYPKGLKGEDIILEARILAVSDVVEAMASHRPYRAAIGIEKALDEIRQHKGSLFDADVVEACLRLFDKGFTFNT